MTKVVGSLIQENQALIQRSDFLYNTMAHYIDYRGHSDKFAKHLEKLAEKQKVNKKEQKNDSQGKTVENPIRK